MAGGGTCALDDDVCTSRACRAPLLCVRGECVNACTSVVECPRDATCEPIGDGRARCVPVPSGVDAGQTMDAAQLDAGPSDDADAPADAGIAADTGRPDARPGVDAANDVGNVLFDASRGDAGAPAPVELTFHGGATGSVAGWVQIEPPQDAALGDIVILLLERPGESGPIAPVTGTGWTSLGVGLARGAYAEGAQRHAAADEASSPARYRFPASGGASWVIVVAHGASAAGTRTIGPLHAPFMFGGVASTAGDLLIEALDLSDDASACTFAPSGVVVAIVGHWALGTIIVPASGTVAPHGVTCTPAPSSPDAASFEIVARP